METCYCVNQKLKGSFCHEIIPIMDGEVAVLMSYDEFLNMFMHEEDVLREYAENFLDVAKRMFIDQVTDDDITVVFTAYNPGWTLNPLMFKIYIVFDGIENFETSSLAGIMALMGLLEQMVDADEPANLFYAFENRKMVIIQAYANFVPEKIMIKLLELRSMIIDKREQGKEGETSDEV